MFDEPTKSGGFSQQQGVTTMEVNLRKSDWTKMLGGGNATKVEDIGQTRKFPDGFSQLTL